MSLQQSYDVLLLDLDGVVYRGAGAVRHAVAALTGAAAAGVRLGFVTNNAARPAAVVAEHVSTLGIPCRADQVVTSAQVGAQLLGSRIAKGSRVLAVGGPGVSLALTEHGFEPVQAVPEQARGRSDEDIADSVAGVLQGFGEDVSWRDLAVAAYAVAGGAFWVATNTDTTIPRADGIAPGNGTLVSAVSAATGVVPPVAGKPAADMMRIAGERLSAAKPLAIGDRLDTDIRGARAAGIDSLLVLTGVSSVLDVLRAEPAERPIYLAADLRGLGRDLPRLDGSSDDPVARQIHACWQDPTLDRSTAAQQITELLGV